MAIPIDKLPAVPHLRYEEVRNYIQSGDLLLCSGTSTFSRLIKRATGSIWSHVGFILRVDAIDRLMVLESVESIGVRSVALSHYVNNYDGKGHPYKGKLLIARHYDFQEKNIAHFSRKAVDLLGNNYDKKEILRIAYRIVKSVFLDSEKCMLPPNDNKYICSEYVHECYKSIGLNIAHNCGGFISPADFAATEPINAVCMITV
jgi:hypothetical protein